VQRAAKRPRDSMCHWELGFSGNNSHGTQAKASCPGQVLQRVSATGDKSWDVLIGFTEV